MDNIEKVVMKPWYKKPLGLFAITIGVLAIIGSFSGDDKPASVATAETSHVVARVQVPKPVDPAILEADKKQLADLKTKFKYTYDEFQKVGWYAAKTQVVDYTWNEQVLRVNVNNTGYLYLVDQYYGDDWIFHTHIEVKIGDAIYKSEDVPSFDPNNTHNNSSGSVWESISYTGTKDNGIIKAIAESGDAAIRVRFTGDRGSKDFTLTKRDQKAITDAYHLSELIKKLGDIGATK